MLSFVVVKSSANNIRQHHNTVKKNIHITVQASAGIKQSNVYILGKTKQKKKNLLNNFIFGNVNI